MAFRRLPFRTGPATWPSPIVDGQFTLGSFINSTQANDTAYPNDLATFTTNGVTWQDGTIWTNAAHAAITITATDANGVKSQLQVIDTTTLVGLDGSLAGVTGTRLNGKIFWSNGQIWVGFDHESIERLLRNGCGDVSVIGAQFKHRELDGKLGNQ